MANDKPTVLVSLGGGGFLYQTAQLTKKLRGSLDLIFVAVGHRNSIIRKFEGQDVAFFLPWSVNYSNNSQLSLAYNSIRAFLQSLVIIQKSKTDAVVSLGSAYSVPLLLAARCLGRRAIFIDSAIRVHELSRTGKFLDRFGLCHKLYVQWPDAALSSKRGIYRGLVF